MESRGQSSCRGQEDGDGSERPLKKARFAWQVKGKHNSKNETNPVVTSPEEIQGSTSTAPVEEHDTETDSWESRHINSLNDDSDDETMAQENPLNHNFSTRSQNYSYVRSQNYSYGRSLNVRDKSGLNIFEISAEDENSLEDQYLLHWQTQQMVACCTDNIINRITDKLQAPSTTGSNLRALNMAQFLNHLPANNTVENEGILMAISAHGLRNNTSVTHCDDDSDDDYVEADDGNIPTIYQDPMEVNEVPKPNPEPENIEGNNVGFFDDVSEIPDDFLLMNAAIQFAIVTKGLTASGT